MGSKAIGTGVSDELRTKVKTKLERLLKASFSSTLLNLSPDIVNILFSQIFFESRVNFDAMGDSTGYGRNSMGSKYLASSVIQALLTNPATPDETRKNIYKGLRAVGLTQVMGYNYVRGAMVQPSGAQVSELERLRPDLALGIMINPGASFSSLLGESNMSKVITAQLIMLEGKLKSVYKGKQGYQIKGDSYGRVFSSSIEAAIGAYLGVGKSDSNGTTAQAYASSIVYGATYQLANGKDFVARQYTSGQTSSSATTDGSSGTVIIPAGC
jgi:hypothetical protein